MTWRSSWRRTSPPEPWRRRSATPAATLLRSVALFDVYRGAPLGDGEKSLAWRLAVRADDRALDDGEVEVLLGRLVAAVAAAHGGRLRT